MSISKETKLARIIFITFIVLVSTPGICMFIWIKVMTAGEIPPADYYNIQDNKVVEELKSPFLEMKNYKTIKKSEKEFCQKRMFGDNVVIVYVYWWGDDTGRWSQVSLQFFNTTGKTPTVQLSEFTIKDREGTEIFAAPTILLDESNLYKKEKKRKNGTYYCYHFYTFDKKLKEAGLQDEKYYVSFKLDGQPFYDVIERVEKLGCGSIV